MQPYAFYVDHYTHAFEKKGMVEPVNLNFGMSLTSPGYCTYEIPRNNPLFPSIGTFPYTRDFSLAVEQAGAGGAILSGFITEVQMTDPEDVGSNLKVAGKDWGHYFDRIIWPKDPNSSYRTTVAADPTNGTVFDYTGGPLDLVYRLLEQSTTLANSLALLHVNPVQGGTSRYTIQPGDTETIWSKAQEALKLSSGSTRWGVRFIGLFSSPYVATYEFFTTSTTNPVVFNFLHGANCKIITYTNSGIEATRVFGIAQGPSNRKGLYVNGPSIATYRRWDLVEEFTEGSAYNNLPDLTAGVAHMASSTHVEVIFEYFPGREADPPFWTSVKPGATIHMYGDIGYTIVDQNLIVTAIEGSTNEDGNVTITVTADNQG